MKRILIYPLFLLLGGCVMLGRDVIHSPQAEGAQYSRCRHVHGGARKNSPPNSAFLLSKKDSTDLIVSAHVISGKNNWGGLLFPVFPTFFFPRIDYYKEYPNSLIIELKASSHDSFTLVKDLIIIRVGDRILKPKALEYKGHSYNSQTFTLEPLEPFILKAIRDDPDYIKLEFPIRANDVQEFTLLVHGLYRKARVVEFPEISFKKTKQRWSFVGP